MVSPESWLGPGIDQTTDVLFEILADRESNGRVHAAESLYKIGEVGDGTAAAQAFEQTENQQLRLMAAAALAKAGHQDALTHLRQQLASDDPQSGIPRLLSWPASELHRT